MPIAKRYAACVGNQRYVFDAIDEATLWAVEESRTRCTPVVIVDRFQTRDRVCRYVLPDGEVEVVTERE